MTPQVDFWKIKLVCQIVIIGFSAAFCTYIVQDLNTQAIIGLYVAQKYQVLEIFDILLLLSKMVFVQTSSSAEMEPYCAKSVLLNLVHEHELRITSFTTDRSTSVKTAVRLIIKDFVQ